MNTAVQAALIPLGQEGITIIGELRWNMYTSAGWLAASLSLVTIVLFLPCLFHEFNMADKEAKWNQMMMKESNDVMKKNPASGGRDLIGVCFCIFNFSVAGFILIMIETFVPLSSIQFNSKYE